MARVNHVLDAPATPAHRSGRHAVPASRTSASHGARTMLAVVSIGGLVACTTSEAPPCAPGLRTSIVERLYFGLATPDGPLADDDWSAFLRDEVTPRLPDGLTAWRASGQWRTPEGVATREPTMVVEVVHGADAASRAQADAALRDIVDLYRARFRQRSVLRVAGAACSAF